MAEDPEAWVEYGLSKISICEAAGECAQIIQYELLETLLEAMYLISRQDEKIPYQKRRLRRLAGSKAIIELLIAALGPQLIFETGGASPAEQVHYRNLLIILPDSNHKPFKEQQPVIELITAGDEKLCCSVHKLSELCQALETGHVYLSLTCTRENLVYQAKDITLPELSSEKLTEIIQKSRQDFTLGIAKAKKFFYGASYYEQITEYPLCLFMLQQAAETTFRTIAIALNGSEKRTHSIRSLKRFNQRLAAELNEIFPEGPPEEERLLQLLEDAYLEARYNPLYKISKQDLESISLRVSRLVQLAESLFEERMQVIDNSAAKLSETEDHL